MKVLKPHFIYNKKQRNGVFFLILIILIVQLLFYNFSVLLPEKSNNEKENLEVFQSEIDSLKSVKASKKEVVRKINPNFITDSKGYHLGLSIDEIDRLLTYRSKNLWVNSIEEFQKVTKVSDSLLFVLEAKFRFPNFEKKKNKPYKNSKTRVKLDLNKVSEVQLKKINGVGDKLSKRIVKYRKLLGGFSSENQLNEVWGLKSNVIEKILEKLEIKELPKIEKININTATFKEVLSIVYLDYEETKNIFKYKDSVEKIKDLNELKKIEGFPIEKYDRIALYLRAK